MLDAEDIDDDFFTPVASTSLANIFGNVAKDKDTTNNDSLKYVPPKPHNIIPSKKEDTKATECIFACAVTGHEWYNNVYSSRGKLGFAIIQIQKTGEHNLILYNSTKTTLSSTTISTKLEINVRNNQYISYYDTSFRYWSLYCKEELTQKILDLLKGYGANLNFSTYTDTGPPEPMIETKTKTSSDDNLQKNLESDTDSLVNKKTKASILSRMANMGASVLPTRVLPGESSSDSSVTSGTDIQMKANRHKSFKTCIKKNNGEQFISDHQNVSTPYQEIVTTFQKDLSSYNNQILPVTNPILSNTMINSNDFGLFISEQRINNSEMRINMNRITDKIDAAIDKINNLDCKDKSTNIPSDILTKLLTEYENKIKIYEDLLTARGLDPKNILQNQLVNSMKDHEVELLQNKISALEKENEEKDLKLSMLKDEIELLKDCREKQTIKENELSAKINNLESDLDTKNKAITDLTNAVHATTDITNEKIDDKVKNIINNTFQTLSMNFQAEENYSGYTINRIIGSVIKKNTIQSLSKT